MLEDSPLGQEDSFQDCWVCYQGLLLLCELMGLVENKTIQKRKEKEGKSKTVPSKLRIMGGEYSLL